MDNETFIKRYIQHSMRKKQKAISNPELMKNFWKIQSRWDHNDNVILREQQGANRGSLDPTQRPFSTPLGEGEPLNFG